MEQYPNTLFFMFIIMIVVLEAWGIQYTLQFRSRLMFLIPWSLAVILTVALLIEFNFIQIAHNAEYEIIQFIKGISF